MKNTSKIISLSLACAMAAACTPQGYYDSTGVYRVNGEHVVTERHVVTNDVVLVQPTPVTVVHMYDRAGYYDRNGVYISPLDSGPHVAREYLPSRGDCRVWFINRAPDDQPMVDSCTNVYGYVPENAYVIYGG